MTRRLSRCAVPLCVLLSGLLAVISGPVASAAHALADPGHPSAGQTWQRSMTVPLRADGSLSDVVALSASNVWAVGQEGIWDVWQNRGAITHWDGTTWSDVGIRNDVGGAGHLRSIAAASASELWVVGEAHDGLPYVARGDGTAFDRVSVPGLRGGDWLGAVGAVRGKAVAVGSRGPETLIATGSGGRWTVATGQSDGALYGVALFEQRGWAVGDTGTGPLILRLTDGEWETVDTPKVKGGYLRDIYVSGEKRAIAVGGVYHGPEKVRPLVLRWNGKRWSRLPVPDRRAQLYGVTGDGDGRFWVSGFDPQHPGEAFVLRYEGRESEVVRGEETTSPRTVRLLAIAHVPATATVWAVGHVVDARNRFTDIVERFGPAKEM